MLLADYLNSQFSLAQNLDFFARLIAAFICGTVIGLERTRRFKGAGIRTHIIVCCAAALLMIISKYGFADMTSPDGVLFNGTRGADSARIAAQVVSGISFLGAGVIFKYGSSVRGLTTAAGLWATAGIGLAFGAGMYVVGIFTVALMMLMQFVLHRFRIGADSMILGTLRFTVESTEEFRTAWAAYLAERRIRVTESSITYLDDGYATYELTILVPPDTTRDNLDEFLRLHGGARYVSYASAG